MESVLSKEELMRQCKGLIRWDCRGLAIRMYMDYTGCTREEALRALDMD